MVQAVGYAAKSVAAPLERYSFERRDPGPDDVQVEIAYCGICHSDIHQVRDEWGGSVFPMVPGHEIVGKVTKVGANVSRFKEGDLAAVGVMVDSCKVCEPCKQSEEPYCEKGMVGTYNAKDYDGSLTFGGYSNNIVVDQRYVHSVSPKLDLAAVAPLLCAGITTYSPLKHWKVGPGTKVGIIGLGGLGHMGLKFAHSFGAKVVLFTTSKDKVEDGKRLGADEVVVTKEEGALDKHKGSFDFLLDCVSAKHDLNPYMGLLKLNGTLCLVGLPEVPFEISPFQMVTNRRSFAGSMIGGMKETQEMLDYCAEHNIVSDIEMTSVDKLDEAYDRVLKSDVKYRFVIDLTQLKPDAATGVS